jgi:iron(III) transport system substrate-binding protein
MQLRDVRNSREPALPHLLNRRGFALCGSAAALAACAPSERAYVNVYSARHYDADRTLYAAFEEATGVAVRVLPANAEQLLERLRAEGEATEADLVVAADAGNLWRMQDANLLAPVTSAALSAGVPQRLRDAAGHWWGFTKRARIIVYRKDAVAPDDVASMDNLTQARFSGQVVARSSTNTYNLSLLASRIERLGADNARDWAAGVRANFARDPQGSDTDQIKAVAAGLAQVAIANHYYVLRLARSDDNAEREAAAKVGIVFPDQGGAGAHTNISGAGVAAHAKRPERALQLLEYLVSDDAQRLLAPLNDEFPIRPEIEAAPELDALGAFKVEDVALDALGRRQREAAAIYEEVGWR